MYLEHTRLWQFHGFARSNSQFLTPVPSLKLFRLMQVCEFLGLPAVQFWECVLATLTSEPTKGNCEHQRRERIVLSDSMFESIDDVPANILNSSHPTQLCIFEDTAAVIQMIIKGRSPTLRHVSRTHRVD